MSMGNLAMVVFGHQYADSRARITWIGAMAEALVQIRPSPGAGWWSGQAIWAELRRLRRADTNLPAIPISSVGRAGKPAASG
jgi:hypothetical protein